MVSEIERCADEPAKVKVKCLGLRHLLDSILGRNKLHRPSRPTTSGIQIQEYQPPTVEREQERERVEEIPMQGSETQPPVDTQWSQEERQPPPVDSTTGWPQWQEEAQTFAYDPSQWREWKEQSQDMPPPETNEQGISEFIFGPSQSMPPPVTQEQTLEEVGPSQAVSPEGSKKKRRVKQKPKRNTPLEVRRLYD